MNGVAEGESHHQARLQWQCRRGMLELDLLLRGFLAKGYANLSAAEKLSFDRLLQIPDPQLLEYLMGREQPEDKELTDVVARVRAVFTD